MAILKSGNQEVTVPDGEPFIDQAEELGVPFGCTAGNCGTCITVVKEGMENLSSPTSQEEEFSLQDGERLLCQCKINSGTVVIQV